MSNQLYDIWEDIKEDDMRENSQTDKDMTERCKKCKYCIICNKNFSQLNSYLSENYDYWQKIGHTARHSHKFHIKCYAML